jgi:hypothetical protein
VLATNDPPTLTGIPNQFLNEDTSSPALLFTISDVETAPGNLSVSVSSSNPGLVSSNGLALGGSGTDRTLTITPEPEQSGVVTVTLSVTDGGASSNISFVVAVQPVNDPPTLNALGNVVMNSGATGLSLALNGITSGASNETQTLVVTATSSNPGILPHPTVTYNSPNVSGSLALNSIPGTNGTATVTVTVNDGGRGNSTTNRTFTVTINGRPRLSELPDRVTDEDALLVVPFTMADGETTESALTLTAFSSNTNLVAVTNIVFAQAQGVRTVSLRPNTNAFGNSTITLQVADADGLTAVESFEWVVQPVNDAPTLDPLASRALLEDAGLQLVTLTGITSGATNENDELSVSAFTTEPGLLTSLQVDYLSSSPTGTLSFVPGPNAFGTTTVNVVVTDGRSLNGSVTQQWVISVVASNDAPSIFGLTNATTLEDVPALVGFIVSDLETPGAALGIQATASNAQLLPPGALQVVGSESSRALLISPAPNQSGLSDITVTVTDGQGGTAAVTFVFTVTPVNDPPTLGPLADVTINQDTPSAPLPFTVFDADDPVTSIQVVGASSNLELVPEGNVAVLGTSTNRQVIITPASGRTGTAVIQLTARDPAGAASSGRFRLTVQRVLQAPVIQTQPADVAVAAGGTANFGVTATGSGTLSYQWFHQGVALPGRVASTLSLTGVKGSDAGNYSVEIRNAVGSVGSRDAVLQVDEFRITGISRNVGTTEIFFTTTSGRSYVVEYSTDLGSGTWPGLPAVAGTGGTVSVTDSAATGQQRFYRVREQ